MKHRNTVFHRLLSFLPRHHFQNVVDRHQGDRKTRSLRCWDQLVAMLFCQLSNRQSIRDVVDGFNSKHQAHYHLGTREIRRSTLSDANQKRPVAIFKETYFYLLEKIRHTLNTAEHEGMVRLIDSTTIDLNLNQFKWADFRSTKAGIKLHTVYDPNAEVPVYFAMTKAKMNDRKALDLLPVLKGKTYVVDRAYNDYRWYYELTNKGAFFVGRMKTNALYDVTETRQPIGENILTDEVISLSSDKAKKDCPIPLRRVTFVREEDSKKLEFITNDFQRSAKEIADLYKQRWQIELFFKWIKQNLKIKKFLGQSENAVMTQVLVAMIAYVLLKLVQLDTKSPLSLQKIARLMSLHIMNRQELWELLNPDPGRNKKSKEPPLQMELEACYV